VTALLELATKQIRSFVEIGLRVRSPGENFVVTEPELDLTSSRVLGVRTVDNVSAHIDGKISSDGTGFRVQRIGSTNHLAASLNDTLAFENNEDGGAGGDEANKLVIERLALVLTVVLLSEVLGGDNKLHSDELETSLFPAGEDFTNKVALNAVRLDNEESSVHLSCCSM
jgi:hypothetical protein